ARRPESRLHGGPADPGRRAVQVREAQPGASCGVSLRVDAGSRRRAGWALALALILALAGDARTKGLRSLPRRFSEGGASPHTRGRRMCARHPTIGDVEWHDSRTTRMSGAAASAIARCPCEPEVPQPNRAPRYRRRAARGFGLCEA